jgi:hypothetical protein
MTFPPANFDPSIDPTVDLVRALRDAGPDLGLLLGTTGSAFACEHQSGNRTPHRLAWPASVSATSSTLSVSEPIRPLCQAVHFCGRSDG